MVSTFNSRTDPGVKDLEILNISKSFNHTVVLNALNLDIYKGELCCLLGPSGCGKTTLLKIINGLLNPDSGSVILNGGDITSLSCQKRDLGMVFQNYALFPHMDVSNNVAYGLRRRHIPKNEISQKVNNALSLVRLSGYGNRRIHELSGGQQQRVALARALVIEPRVLLLDEPLSNLDARLRADMRDEIKRIQKQLGITTIYVTHDQEEAMSIADRIVVMNEGNIEQTGTPFEIYEYPASEFVAGFVGNINLLSGEIFHQTLVLFGSSFKIPEDNMLNDGNVTCAIRPERINITDSDEAEITGIIVRTAYFGSSIRYDVQITTQSESTLIVQLPVSTEAYDIGDTVGIEFKFSDLKFFENH
jgi:putative spermidine/putrescine transport system ATP-binding protein